MNSIKHKRMIQNINSNQLLTIFIPQENSAENFKVAIAEMSQIYHSVSHHHSYLSMDCGIKLNSKIYDDSKLSKKIHCGRTKSESIVKNVLAPKSIEMVLQEMCSDKYSFHLPFSIAIDASNKGNRKFFPIAVRYFHPVIGIRN